MKPENHNTFIITLQHVAHAWSAGKDSLAALRAGHGKGSAGVPATTVLSIRGKKALRLVQPQHCSQQLRQPQLQSPRRQYWQQPMACHNLLLPWSQAPAVSVCANTRDQSTTVSVKQCCQLRFHCCNACITQQQSTQINVQSISVCAKCGRTSDAKASCCAKGGSWRGQCGPPGDDNFEHTWGQGFEACKVTSPETTTPTTATTTLSPSDSVAQATTAFVSTSGKFFMQLLNPFPCKSATHTRYDLVIYI